jgi:hypothetical protein
VSLKSQWIAAGSGYLAAPEQRPQWLRTERWLGDHGIQQGTPAGWQEFERQMERLEEVDEQALGRAGQQPDGVRR